MLKALIIQSLDPHLGRVDISTLSDQTLMEVVVECVNDEAKKDYQDENEMFLEVCEWVAIGCDDDGRVVVFHSIKQLGGVLQLSFLPPKLINFCAEMSDSSGTLDTSALPASLDVFSIWGNNFDGTIDFTALPPKIECFNVSTNVFTGSAVLDSLPDTLEDLHLGLNKFSGTLCLTKLPRGLRTLGVSRNSLTGKFHLENGHDDITVYASHNSFAPVAVIQKSVYSVELRECGVETVLNDDGETHNEIGKRISYEN